MLLGRRLHITMAGVGGGGGGGGGWWQTLPYLAYMDMSR